MQSEHLSPITVEVLLLSEDDGCLRYRRLSRLMSAGAHPDDVARLLSGLSVCTPGAVLHSTSWRFGRAGFVLTYAALPDPAPDSDCLPVLADATASGGPLAPSPTRVDIDAVAGHACRHLALLATTDDEVAAAARSQPDLWELLSKLAPGPAGGLRTVSLNQIEEPV